MPDDYEQFLPEGGDAARRDEVRPFSPDEMVTCEECLRSNPPTRLNCFYCGAKLAPSETAARLQRRPTLRQPEKWEEGYNVILCEQAKMTEDLLRDVASLVRLEQAEARRILEATEALPLARINSMDEARLVEERLRACGLSVLVASDADLMMKDDNRKRARAFDFADNALFAYVTGSNEVLRAEWSEVLLLVTGRLVMRRIEIEERRNRRESEMVEAREMTGDVLLLDLYTTAHDGGWRVVSDQFDFSCLAERKGLIAGQNFASLVALLRERAPQMITDDSYNPLRQALASVWPPEERTESRGLRRERPGRFNRESVMMSDNEMQFTRYSRLRHFLKLRQMGTLS